MKGLDNGDYSVSPDGVRHERVEAVGLQLPQHLLARHRIVAAVQQDGLSASIIEKAKRIMSLKKCSRIFAWYFTVPVSVAVDQVRSLSQVLLHGVQAGLMDDLVHKAVPLEQLVKIIGSG